MPTEPGPKKFKFGLKGMRERNASSESQFANKRRATKRKRPNGPARRRR